MYGSQLGPSQAASCGQDFSGPDAPVYGAVFNCQMCALLVYTIGPVSEVIRFAPLALHLYLKRFLPAGQSSSAFARNAGEEAIPPPVSVFCVPGHQK